MLEKGFSVRIGCRIFVGVAYAPLPPPPPSLPRFESDGLVSRCARAANSLRNKLVYGLVTFFARRGRGVVGFVLLGISSTSFERI